MKYVTPYSIAIGHTNRKVVFSEPLTKAWPTTQTMKQVKTLQELCKLALKKKSVICNKSWCFKKPIPAAFMQNLQGRIINDLLQRWMYIYEPKKKVKKVSKETWGQSYLTDDRAIAYAKARNIQLRNRLNSMPIAKKKIVQSALRTGKIGYMTNVRAIPNLGFAYADKDGIVVCKKKVKKSIRKGFKNAS
jgi:hypothetical protein